MPPGAVHLSVQAGVDALYRLEPTHPFFDVLHTSLRTTSACEELPWACSDTTNAGVVFLSGRS